MCKYEGCNTIPIYNFEGETKKLFCVLHKKEGMVDVKNKKCIEKNCKSQCNFNFIGQLKGLYCSIHKKDGMIDVKHITCKNKEFTILNTSSGKNLKYLWDFGDGKTSDTSASNFNYK